MRGPDHFERTRSRDLRAAQTSAEANLWGKLRGRRLGGYKFVRQEPIEGFFADFVCREQKLVIEVDGATHSTDEEVAYDARRERILKAAGFRILRVQNDDIRTNIDGVCETILRTLAPDSLSP
ncbi:endonuclease domain-containing protein [Methylocystis parvus]|uniref:Endonuclease domain-containing protein n=1 Tax=Methylocystis parvus TaxID=134 RepID=A0A6B8MBD4_9HYPH|nr:endonuclease domain-containing protein [Methylocystis parvus]QGM98603.1 endonuclease domain-containing protein [Methylocystis parvus]